MALPMLKPRVDQRKMIEKPDEGADDEEAHGSNSQENGSLVDRLQELCSSDG